MNAVWVLLATMIAVTGVNSISEVSGMIDPPRKQMANGISAENVICKKELQLMLKSNGNAICVKHQSVERLVSLGQAEIVQVTAKSTEKNENAETSKISTSSKNDDTDISPENIIVHAERPIYSAGSVMVFTGTAQPNMELEISLEDSDGNETYVDILEIDGSGKVHIEIITEKTFDDGEYFLILKQQDDSEIVPVSVGEHTGDISVTIEQFHFDFDSRAQLEIVGPGSSRLALEVFDSHDEIRFADTVTLDSEGVAEYSLDLAGYKKGAYSIVMSHASEETVEEFTVGLRAGTEPIEITVTDNIYKRGETVLVIGKTTPNTQILIELKDPHGETVDRVEHYANNDGKFSLPLKIPLGKSTGIWKVHISNAERASEASFEVVGKRAELTVMLDSNGPFAEGDFVTISGTGADTESIVTIRIESGGKLSEITPHTTVDGTFSEAWQVPSDFHPGTYAVTVDDGISQATTTLTVVDIDRLHLQGTP